MVEEGNVGLNHGVCSRECTPNDRPQQEGPGDPHLLSIWRKSIALYQPSCKSHLPPDLAGKKNFSTWKQSESLVNDREVLDAAEALTCLSRASFART